MSTYREHLPQLNDKLCVTDGGMETDLLFNHGIDLPEFASYDLLRTTAGEKRLFEYFRPYVDIAHRFNLGLILETPTWRANPDWAKRIGDSPESLTQLIRASVKLIERVRTEQGSGEVPIVISGCIGPRGDGYVPADLMSAQEAQNYHNQQIAIFSDTAVDMIAALTLNYPMEAIGIARAAADHGLPVCLSFTVETDGNLPTGQSLKDAITDVDQATDGYPAYYMINCAHPTHFEHLFEAGGDWLKRVKGLRGNASRLSHAELDTATTLDDGNPDAFGREMNALRALSPYLTVLGGCCGTDHRHIEQVGRLVADVPL